MSQEEFLSCKEHYAKQIQDIRLAAHELHQSVNDTFGSDLPYGFHLDMVVENISCYGHLVCPSEDDVLPLFFGGYFHDSIENARLTYNDVLKTARQWLTEEQAQVARDIRAKVPAEAEANLAAQAKKIEMIAQGRLNKFLKENTLVEQAYIMSENKELVKDILKAKGVEIKDFRRITLSAE